MHLIFPFPFQSWQALVGLRQIADKDGSALQRGIGQQGMVATEAPHQLAF